MCLVRGEALVLVEGLVPDVAVHDAAYVTDTVSVLNLVLRVTVSVLEPGF